MTKLNESQENNLNPNCTPFIDAYKSTLLATAYSYGLPVEENISLSQLHVIIKNHEDEQRELSQRTIEYNHNYFGEYEKHIINKAIAYHIPVVMDNLDITKLCLEVDDYEWLLDQAGDRLLDWDTSNYDPEGLQQAINDCDDNNRQEQIRDDWRCYITGIRVCYNSSRGV